MDLVPASPLPPVIDSAPPASPPWYHWRRWGWNFLTFSILFHVLLGIVAAYFIVAVIHPARKQDFAAPGPKGPNAPTRALEHKVQMAKKQNSMSAPVAVKRVTTTGVSKTALPAMPAMPKLDAAVLPATAMGGMGGTGMGLGGFGGGGSGGGGGGGGGGLNFFGLRNNNEGLVGTFYDLKQNPSRQDTKMTPELFGTKVRDFVKGGFNLGLLAGYYKASKPLYATHIFTPVLDADLAPKEFGVDKEVKPRMWLVHYKGSVVAPVTGTFHFVGIGDDVLVVRFNNRIVLDGCLVMNVSDIQGQTYRKWAGRERFQGGIAVGPSVEVEAGKTYTMEVLIGEQPGGYMNAELLIEQEGEKYAKDRAGADIIPFFRTVKSSSLPPPPPGSDGGYPPYAYNGPFWTVVNSNPGLASLVR